MPLKKGKENIGYNIKELMNSGYPQKQAEAIAIHEAEDEENLENNASSRVPDINGMIEIEGNPISKVGVFEYSGLQIDPMGEDPSIDPNKIYNVYRPSEELMNEECLESFRLLPWTDEHYAMVGIDDPDLRDVGETGVQGSTGENIYFEDPYLKGNLKVFTQKLANLIEKGKVELSIGYKCIYDKVKGIWNGMKYDFIQRNIRGNHIALVESGRSGPDVSVLDSKCNNFILTIDHKRFVNMADNNQEEEKKTMDDEESEKDTDGQEEKKENTEDDDEITEESSISEPDSDRDNIKKEVLCDILMANVQELVNKIKEFGNEKDVDNVDPDDDDEYEEGLDKGGKDEEEKGKLGAMDSKIKYLTKELASLKKNSIKNILKEVSARDSFVQKIKPYVGSFDGALNYSNMTTEEIAKYAVKKLGIPSIKGSEITAVNAFIAGKKSSSSNAFVFDSSFKKTSNQISEYLKRGNE